MIIENRKPILIKRIFVGMIVLIFILVVGFSVWYFFIKANKVAIPGSNTDSFSNTISSNEESAAKKTEKKTLPEIEAENKFMSDKGECKKKFMGLENMTSEEIDKLQASIVDINVTNAKYYYTCQAIKNGNSKYCDAVKVDGSSYDFCQKGLVIYSEMIFPALRSNSCDQQISAACAKSGVTDCENVCQGLISNNSDACNQLKDIDGSPDKSTCLAINNKEIKACSSLKTADDQQTCNEMYYFIRAAKDNDPSLLNSIEDINGRAIFELYFNKNYRCEKLLVGFGDNACDRKYNYDYLQTLKSTATNSQVNNDNK
jgi:hypothetical protein